MARFFCALLLGLFLFLPVPAHAAGVKVGVAVTREDDGSACGEVWYNDRLVWRLKIVSDGARATAGAGGGNTTVVAPDVRDGMFVLKIFRE